MPFTAPITRSTGYVVGSTQWNELVNDTNWLATAKPMALVKRSSSFTVNSSTITAINWNVNHLDTAGSHSIAVNPTRFTAPVAGWYRLAVNVKWQANTTGDRDLFVGPSANPAGVDTVQATASSFETGQSVEGYFHLNAADWVEASGIQTSGGALSILVDSYAWFEWISTF